MAEHLLLMSVLPRVDMRLVMDQRWIQREGLSQAQVFEEQTHGSNASSGGYSSSGHLLGALHEHGQDGARGRVCGSISSTVHWPKGEYGADGGADRGGDYSVARTAWTWMWGLVAGEDEDEGEGEDEGEDASPTQGWSASSSPPPSSPFPTAPPSAAAALHAATSVAASLQRLTTTAMGVGVSSEQLAPLAPGRVTLHTKNVYVEGSHGSKFTLLRPFLPSSDTSASHDAPDTPTAPPSRSTAPTANGVLLRVRGVSVRVTAVLSDSLLELADPWPASDTTELELDRARDSSMLQLQSGAARATHSSSCNELALAKVVPADLRGERYR
jgi:hypothetical protein